MVDVVVNVGLYSPVQLTDVQRAGATTFNDLNSEDVSFLYTCRTRIPEVGHVIQFLYRYIFSGEMRVEPRGPIADWVDFRTIGHRVLEQLLVYGICFVSYDKDNEEPIVWDLAELNVQTRRTPQGHLEFRARVAPSAANGISRATLTFPVATGNESSSTAKTKDRDARLRKEADQPRFIVLVHKYPENSRLVSSLMALKPKLQLIQPSVFAAMVATIRSANPVVYFTHNDTGKMSMAARHQWSQGDGAQIQRYMQDQATAEQLRMMHFFEQVNARYSQPAMSAMQLAYNTDDQNSAAVAWSVMEATTRSPIRPLPSNYDVATGPTPSADLKFCEFLHEDVRMQVARAFGLPNSIFSPDERYMASSVAGLTRSMMENSMNHFSALVRASINYIYKYLVLEDLDDEALRKYGFSAQGEGQEEDTKDDEKPPKRASSKRKSLVSAPRGRYAAPVLPSATAESDVVTVEIMRRMDIEYIMLLKPELKRECFIELLAETMGLSTEDFEKEDKDLQQQKELMILQSQIGAKAPGSSSSSGKPSKKPKPNPLKALSTSATAKLK